LVKEGLGSNARPKAAKLQALGLAGLAGLGKNRYTGRNLWFSYDRVSRVGPFRTRSFLLPEQALQKSDAGPGSDPPPDRLSGPASTNARQTTRVDQF
jgi:hypothetical protein